MRVLSSAEMRAAEASAVSGGCSYEQLMENAGTAAVHALLPFLEQFKPKPLLFLCGKGNNGGDGLVMARLLFSLGFTVSVSFICGKELSELSLLNLDRMPDGVSIIPASGLKEAIQNCAAVFDGVFGIGFHGDLPTDLQLLFEDVNHADCLRVALDIPSGVDCDTGSVSPGSFTADYTLTFGAYKPALLMEKCKPFCGEIQCLEIGL